MGDHASQAKLSESSEMKCPVCTATDLMMTERSGIEIDYCPQCRGVWLDRGELDKIIERSVSGSESHAPRESRAYPNHQWGSTQSHHHERHEQGHGYPRKKSFWHELFD